MKMMLTLAALAAAASALPVHAEPAPAPRSVTVVHSDLDLGSARGAHRLERRIWQAGVAVCGSAPDYDLEGKNDVQQCRRDTMRQASADAERVIASAATRGEPIQVTLAK